MKSGAMTVVHPPTSVMVHATAGAALVVADVSMVTRIAAAGAVLSAPDRGRAEQQRDQRNSDEYPDSLQSFRSWA